jgi:hypothetical protein
MKIIIKILLRILAEQKKQNKLLDINNGELEHNSLMLEQLNDAIRQQNNI